MKKYLAPVLLTLGLATCVIAADAPPTDVVIIGHDKVDAAFAKGGPLHLNSKFKIQAGHREGPGQVEIHTYDTDIFFVTEGTATIVTGGTAVAPKETGPGETRADKSTGGTSHQLSKGDVMIIPAGIPHWMTETSKPFVYFVVKVTK